VNKWDIVYLLWSRPEREYHYVAIDYLKRMPKSGFQKVDHLKLKEIITTNSWWDSVDGIASNSIGKYFKQFPDMIPEVIGSWRNDSDMWLNRTCLIYQLKYKGLLDFELLKSLILQYITINEFFIQKAIGWSLRQHSKHNPDQVQEFIKDLQLSTVAKREATKYL